jgi:hypothetical protein
MSDLGRRPTTTEMEQRWREDVQRLTGVIIAYAEENAALLAQRDRYEAALREIAGMKATRYAEVNVMQAVAWEALAAAQEEAT